jgi:hypothetical protein
MGLLPLAFEQNLGQADASVLYLAHTSSGVMRFTRTQVQLPCAGGQGGLSFNIRSLGQQPANVHTKGAVSGRVNYYPSSDRSTWIEGVALQPELDYSQIAQGVDLVFHGDEGRLEYDFEVAAEANPDAVSFAPDFGASFSLQSDGSARLHTASANNCSAEGIGLLAPIAYQTRNGHRVPIQVAFRLDNEGQLGFSVASYDHHLPLVIDPVVSYTHIIGVNNSTTVNGVQADSSGNVYVTGETAASNYPVVGGQSGLSSGSEEVYITKLDPTGTQILFSTYIPAPGFNSASAIALDPSGNVYVAGVAGSASFPTTSQNLGTCSSFCNTGFAAKFSPAGTMVYSTLLGSGQQLPKSIVVDAAGELYIAGLTADSGLQTVNSFQSTYLAGLCTSCTGPFFGKLNAAGDAWVFSSYFSSGAYDALEAFASGIALDTTGNVYIAGPGNTVPLQNWFENGVGEYFVAEFSPNRQSLIFSTLLGGNSSSQYDSLAAVQVGSDGTIYLAGSEYAPDFPFTANAFLLPVRQSNFPRLFALAINPAHTGLTYSTSLGDGNANATALDAKGNFYLGGSYGSASLPFKNALARDSLNSGFIAELDPTGALLNATGFGGRNTTQVPAGLALDGSGNIYIAGVPDSTGISNGTLDPINVGTGTTYSAQSALGLSTSFIQYSTFIAKITPANQPQISLSYQNPFLELRNAGSADLHISSVQVSGGFASANSTCGSTVPAGTSCFLTPASSSGDTANGNVTINSDAVPASQSFTPPSASVGNGVPIGGNLVVDASQMVFAPQQAGTTSPARTLTLTNTGTASLTVNSILTFGYFAETNNCGVLAPQASCSAQITVSPTANGLSSGDIGIVYNTNLRTDVFAYFHAQPNHQSVARIHADHQFRQPLPKPAVAATRRHDYEHLQLRYQRRRSHHHRPLCQQLQHHRQYLCGRFTPAPAELRCFSGLPGAGQRSTDLCHAQHHGRVCSGGYGASLRLNHYATDDQHLAWHFLLRYSHCRANRATDFPNHQHRVRRRDPGQHLYPSRQQRHSTRVQLAEYLCRRAFPFQLLHGHRRVYTRHGRYVQRCAKHIHQWRRRCANTADCGKRRPPLLGQPVQPHISIDDCRIYGRRAIHYHHQQLEHRHQFSGLGHHRFQRRRLQPDTILPRLPGRWSELHRTDHLQAFYFLG